MSTHSLASSSSHSDSTDTCVVCRQAICDDHNTNKIAISPYPQQVHGHCWLHIIHKDSPIPWPKELPVWKNNKNGSKSSKYALSQKSLAAANQQMPLPPTVKKLQSVYKAFSKEMDKLLYSSYTWWTVFFAVLPYFLLRFVLNSCCYFQRDLMK